MRPNTTLKKLSENLNLSISTVSRALKNHPDISDVTKKKVWELANVLEYEPNTFAINLRTNNSKLFGLIVPAISNYFYDSLFASLEEETRLHGYSLLILQSGDNPEVEQNNLKLCKQNRVAGIFVSVTTATKDISPFLKLSEYDIPIIFLDKVPTEDNCNKICVADADAAILAAEALIEKNKKNVLAFFGDTNMSISRERLDSFTSYFKTKSHETKLQIEIAKNSIESYQKTLEKMKNNECYDSIFCMSDEILTGVMKAIQYLKLQIPTKIGVIAISDGYIPKLYYPEITYIETSGYKLGKLAYTRMLSCLAGSSFSLNLKVEALLVKGGSL